LFKTGLPIVLPSVFAGFKRWPISSVDWEEFSVGFKSPVSLGVVGEAFTFTGFVVFCVTFLTLLE
jgi:hypothetical protein